MLNGSGKMAELVCKGPQSRFQGDIVWLHRCEQYCCYTVCATMVV